MKFHGPICLRLVLESEKLQKKIDFQIYVNSNIGGNEKLKRNKHEDEVPATRKCYHL